jgi:hypothetical protein
MMTKARLAQIAGVWEGTYTHLTPGGEILDQHQSRQETRLEGDCWYERIVYRWPDRDGRQAREQTLDFRARFVGDELVFDDARLQGEAFSVMDEIGVFAYRWKDTPRVRVVETIVSDATHHKARVWQTFEDGALAKVTIIVERRVAEEPAIWH